MTAPLPTRVDLTRQLVGRRVRVAYTTPAGATYDVTGKLLAAAQQATGDGPDVLVVQRSADPADVLAVPVDTVHSIGPTS